MKKILKSVSALSLSTTLLLSSVPVFANDYQPITTTDTIVTTSSAISEAVSTTLSGVNVVPTDYSYLVPLRLLSESIDFTVDWSEGTRTTTVTSVNMPTQVVASFTISDTSANLGDGSSYELMSEPTIIDDSMYIDFIDFMIIFGVNVDIDTSNGDYTNTTIYLTPNEMFLSPEEIIKIQEETTKLMMDIVSSDEANALTDKVLSSDNLMLLLNDISSSEYFDSAMNDLFYNEYIDAIYEYTESSEAYKQYISDAKQLDSYKALCEETGYDDLFLTTQDLNFDEYLKFSFAIYQAPSYMQFSIDSMQLDSYKAYMQEAMNDTTLNELAMEYTNYISTSENLMLFAEDCSNSEFIEPLITEISNSQEFIDFSAYVENLFTKFYGQLNY